MKLNLKSCCQHEILWTDKCVKCEIVWHCDALVNYKQGVEYHTAKLEELKKMDIESKII